MHALACKHIIFLSLSFPYRFQVDPENDPLFCTIGDKYFMGLEWNYITFYIVHIIPVCVLETLNMPHL